ncbi:MAG: matrixin family metalloprotease [Pirellulales bacterium]
MLYALSGREWANTDVSASFLPDGTPTEGYLSGLFAELDPVAPREVWQREFARALQTWANASNLNFRFVADDGSPTGTSGLAQGDSRFGDIRLGAHPLDGYVAYAYYPSGTTKGGDITINPGYTFKIGTHIDLYSVLLHEAGHAIGLDHSVSGTVMYSTIKGVYTGLTADDVAGVQAIYGARAHDSYDAAAPNDCFDTAAALALDSLNIALRADLTSLADVDYYQISLPDGSDGTLSVSVDARGVSLLAPKLSIYDSAWNLLAVADAGGNYGSVAGIELAGLAAGQTLYVVADGAVDDAFGMGAYWLNIMAGGNVPSPEPEPEPEPGPGPAGDRFEVNDTFSMASNLGKFNSQTQTDLSIHTATDVDYYRFTVAKSGTFRVSIQFAHSAGNLDMVVYDSAQRVLASGSSLSDNESVTLSLSSGQTYYVGVASPSGAQNVYDLAIAKSNGGGGGKGGGAMMGPDIGHGTDAAGFEADHDHDHHGDHGIEPQLLVGHSDDGYDRLASIRWKPDAAYHAWDVLGRGNEQASDRQQWGTQMGQDLADPDWAQADQAANTLVLPLGWAERQAQPAASRERDANGPVDDDWADAMVEVLVFEKLSGDG